MATYAFLRGWIHTGSRHLSDQARHIVEGVLSHSQEFGISKEYAARLIGCWHFPAADGPMEDFVLLGATVKKSMLPLFEMQLARISAEVVDLDGNDKYNIAGRIEVTIEGQGDNEEWVISGGQLDTSSRRPYFLSP